jgi:hypothetical protein
MSQSWLRLAHQSEKNLTTNIDYETQPPPSEARGSAVGVAATTAANPPKKEE